jgi:dihydroorotase
MSVLIRNGRVVDPANSIDAVQDVLVSGGRIERVGSRLPAPDGVTVLDATGKLVCPGFIDIHVHLREPGLEWPAARGRPRLAASPPSAAWPTRTR